MVDWGEVLSDSYVRANEKNEKYLRVVGIVMMFALLMFMLHVAGPGLNDKIFVVLWALPFAIFLVLSKYRIHAMQENKQIYILLQQILEVRSGKGVSPDYTVE